MDSFARLLTVTAEFFGRIGTRAVFFILLYGAIFGIQIMRLDLLHQTALTFLICAACWLAVCLLSIAGMRHPAFLIPAAILLWITIRGTVPEAARGAYVLVAAGEERLERTARQMSQDIPEKVTCNETTYPFLTFFLKDPVTDKARAALYYAEHDGQIVCWDRPGVHPHTGAPLKEVTPAIVERIKYQSVSVPVPPTAGIPERFRPVVERTSDGFVPVVERNRTARQ